MKRIFYAAAALVMLLTVGVPLWTVVPKESKATFFNIFDGGVNLDPRKSLPGTESTSTTVPPKATIPSAPQGPAGENLDALGDLPDPEIGLVIVADTHENTYARNSFDYWSYLEADLNDWDTRDQALYEQGRGLEYAGDGRDRTIASGFGLTPMGTEGSRQPSLTTSLSIRSFPQRKRGSQERGRGPTTNGQSSLTTSVTSTRPTPGTCSLSQYQL